jgi:predicted component of type VI protein secretion system
MAAGPEFPVEYTEKADAAHPEQYLWADAGWLVFCNLARSYARYHHCAIIDGMAPETTHTNLPARPFPKKANVLVPSPTEILIDDDKAWELVRGGISILVGISDGAVATFPFLANVYRLRPGVLTTESALSYQLFTAHFAHYVIGLYPELPLDAAPEALLAFVRDRLHGFLAPFTGDKPEEAVRAEITEAPGDPKTRTLSLTLRPVLKMQGKDVDFTLQIAL